jgi:biotin carboxyl carrier protein
MTTIKAPLGGGLTNVCILSQRVRAGDVLGRISNFSNNIDVVSDENGIVSAIHKSNDDNVLQDDVLYDIDTSQPAPTVTIVAPISGRLTNLCALQQKAQMGDVLGQISSFANNPGVPSTVDGVVIAICRKDGDDVMQGDKLYEIAV